MSFSSSAGRGRPLWPAVAIGVFTGLALVASCMILVNRGTASPTAGVRQKLEQNADFVARVGQVRDFRTDRPNPGPDDPDDVWVYEVEGTKASGRLTVKHETAEDGSERIVWARMQLPSGEVVDLDVDEIETE
jgi:hypothetical protein